MVPFWLPKPTKIASWRRLEASWRRLRASWRRLGASWGGLGGSWDIPEAPERESLIFQDSGGEVVSKNRQKIHQKLKPRRDDMLASIFDRFFLIFEPSWPPGRLLGASWEPLGGILGPLGAS